MAAANVVNDRVRRRARRPGSAATAMQRQQQRQADDYDDTVDIIYISELRIETVIGIFDWERRIKQTVVLDLELAADCASAAASDSVDDTIDYKAVCKRLIELVEQSDCHLVETLAERCATLVRDEFGVRWVRLRLGKPGALRGARDVGVIIERGERG